MKNTLLLTACILVAANLHAQPWFPTNSNGNPPKLQDVIAAYEKNPLHAEADEDEETAGVPIKEGKNYHFDRWLWYWKDHTDENGYLVSPVRAWNEWQNYIRKRKQMSAAGKTTDDQSDWTFQGPDSSPGHYNGVGRINAIAFDPTDSNTYWIGSAGGGVWKTTTNGTSWTAIYNNLPLLGVSDIDINPLNPNTAYLCTGDGDGYDSYSIGVLKTTDGGNTWDSTGLTFAATDFQEINSLVINPADTSSLFAATTNGLRHSTDAGASWTTVLQGNFKQIVYNPADTNIVYLTGYPNNSSDAHILRSTDGGLTWQVVTNVSNVQRINLAVTPANPAIVKAVFANDNNGLEGIYSSSDSGATFTQIFSGGNCSNNILANPMAPGPSDCDGQAWYDLCIAISPTDSNVLYVGGVNTWGSQDGGYSWNIVNQWYSGLPGVETVHADKHFLGFNPIAPNALFEGNDGGIYKSYDPTTLWTDLTNGLGITQFYRIAVTDMATFTIGGAQDNGSKLVNNGAYHELTGGDGMQCQIDYSDPDILYTSSQYGAFNISTDGGNSFQNISNNIASPAPTGSWVTPLVIDPSDPQVIYAGYDQVYQSGDRGQSWASISPVFDNSATIDRIAMATSNPAYMYVLDNNQLHYTTNLGGSWGNINGTFTGTISDIIVNPKNEKNLWVTFSGYGSTKVAEYSLTTHTWKAHNSQLPQTPVNCIAIDSSNGLIYVGTDNAVFYLDTTTNAWVLYNKHLPNVKVNDLQITYTTNELWAGTFGRAMWKTPKFEYSSGISIVPLASDVVTVSPNPNKGSFTIATKNSSFFNKAVAVRLMNMMGATVWHTNGTFSGNGSLNINAGGVSRGTYICEIQGTKAIARAKVIIY